MPLNLVSIALIMMMAVFAISQGLTYPLLAKILHNQGHAEGIIGLSAAMTPLGILLMGTLIGPITQRTGARAWALGTSVSLAATMALLGVFPNIWAWFPLRFWLGIAAASQFIIAETWLLTIAPSAYRGRIMGFYNFLVVAGFALGPFILSITGTDSFLPFGFATLICATSSLMIITLYSRLPRRSDDQSQEKGHTPLSVLPLMAFVTLVTVIMGGVDQVTMAFFSLFLEDRGFSSQQSLRLLTLVLGSGAVFMLLYGFFIDKAPRRLLWLGTLSAATIMPLAFLTIPPASTMIYPLALIWGCAIMPLFILCMVELGERFTGPALFAANGVFAVAWGLGGMALPPVTGTVMQFLGADGFAYVMSSMMALLLVLALWRDHRPPSTPHG